jgi:hypothetical protein
MLRSTTTARERFALLRDICALLRTEGLEDDYRLRREFFGPFAQIENSKELAEALSQDDDEYITPITVVRMDTATKIAECAKDLVAAGQRSAKLGT